MKRFILLLATVLLCVRMTGETLVPDSISNPIRTGFHPDPSICRVGEDYYLVTSSFTWFPGLPIYHSRDLANWSLIGHALTNPKAIDFNGMTDNDGIWAPTLRYHNGTFYLITTAHGCGGNFYMTAKNPAGPWSDPVWLKDAPGIDPSLFLMRTDAVIIQAIAGILRAHGLPSVPYGCRSWTSKKDVWSENEKHWPMAMRLMQSTPKGLIYTK